MCYTIYKMQLSCYFFKKWGFDQMGNAEIPRKIFFREKHLTDQKCPK
jgi:hypothetical protein